MPQFRARTKNLGAHPLGLYDDHKGGSATMWHFPVVLALIVLLSGCASSPPQPPRSEFEALRGTPGAPVDEVGLARVARDCDADRLRQAVLTAVDIAVPAAAGPERQR